MHISIRLKSVLLRCHKYNNQMKSTFFKQSKYIPSHVFGSSLVSFLSVSLVVFMWEKQFMIGVVEKRGSLSVL